MKNGNNPISSLNLKVERLRTELKERDSQLSNLREDHSKLIKDSIQTDRERGLMADAVEHMCNGCNEKNTEVCVVCPLHEIAIQFDLWN